MKVFAWRALARGVLLESVRRKDLWVVAILGFLIIAAAGMLGFFGFSGLEAFAKDLAVTVLGLFSTVVAVMVSCRMLPEEIRQRTLYPLLARPISRMDLLIGKYLGAVIVSWIGLLLLAAAAALALALFRVPLEPIMVQYLMVKMLGLALLCALSVAASAYMTPAAAATLSLLFAFGSGILVRALVMAGQSGGSGMKAGMSVLNGLLPQFGLFDLGSRVANQGWAPVATWVVLALAAYAGLYSSAMLALSWLRFRRQAI
jgi:Cu-processing system permease protein